jgi:hypothetical protein
VGPGTSGTLLHRRAVRQDSKCAPRGSGRGGPGEDTGPAPSLTRRRAAHGADDAPTPGLGRRAWNALILLRSATTCAPGPPVALPARGAARLHPPPSAGQGLGARRSQSGADPRERGPAAQGGGEDEIAIHREGGHGESRRVPGTARSREGSPWGWAAAAGSGGGRSSGADHPRRRARMPPVPRSLREEGTSGRPVRDARSRLEAKQVVAQYVSVAPSTNCRGRPGSI